MGVHLESMQEKMVKREKYVLHYMQKIQNEHRYKASHRGRGRALTLTT